MGKLSIIEILRAKIGSLGFNAFIWANRTTAEKYWDEVYQIEKAHKEHRAI